MPLIANTVFEYHARFYALPNTLFRDSKPQVFLSRLLPWSCISLSWIIADAIHGQPPLELAAGHAPPR